jgi:diguanylate cyclase (GGDEF)-like protein/PAS domain S-box-containing protein
MSEKSHYLPWMCVGIAASAMLLLFPFGSSAGNAVYLGVAAVAAALGLRGAFFRKGGSHELRPIAVGVLLSLVGDLLYAGLALASGRLPTISIADVVYIGSYVSIAIGLLRLVREQKSGLRANTDRLIDVAAIFVVTLLLAWTYVIAPTLADRSMELPVQIRAAIFPVLDAALIALLLRVITSRRHFGPQVRFVAAGVTAWLAADLGNLAVGGVGTVWTRLGWIIGVVLFTTAVWQRSRPVETAVDAVSAKPNTVRIAFALFAVTIPLLVEQAGHLHGHHTSSTAIFVTTIILVVLAIVRAVRLSREAVAAREEVDAQARFNEILAVNSSDAVVVLDEQGRIMREAPLFAALVGHPGSATLGRSLLDFAIPDDIDAARVLVNRANESPGRVVEGELRISGAQDRELWLGIRLRDLHGDPAVRALVCNLHDITSRKEAEERLSHQALHDALTDLPNRILFLDRLEHALRRGGRTGQATAVVYLDLDGFKDVNDRLGHAAGDRLLQEVASRLQVSVREADTVARLGGDEFAVLIEESARPMQEAEVVSERILQALSTPVDVGGRPMTVSASLGIAVSEPLATATSLVRDADVAMYHAKETGRARAVEFQPQMLQAAVARIEMEADLNGALEAGQFHLVYQPVVTLDTERVVGFEALLRWQHPTLGLVPPATFIPIAERSELINVIGRWVLAEACATVARWQLATPTDPPISIAVNLSGRQLASPDLVAEVAGVLAMTGLVPSSLTLEMTETALVQDPVGAARILHSLRALGIRLAIDDFGTGYSSLSYLRQFPVDILKLDRSFVETITRGDKVPPIVRGLLDLGRTLGLEVIAEGVEDAVQRDRLRAERCDLAQGYLFARPLSESAAALLTHVSPGSLGLTPAR